MPPDAPRPERLLAVDGLRGLAVLLVLVHHFVELQLPREIGSWQAYLAVGLGLSFSGVDLFFVLSGFLIGGILLDNREAGNFYRVFCRRRTLRIIPLYYLFLGTCWLLTSLSPDVRPSVHPLGSYFAFLNNFWMAADNAWDTAWLSLAWSLAVEEQFYLFFPFLVRLCPPTILLHLTWGALLAAPLLRIGMILAAPQYALGTHVLTPCRMDSLASGVLVAFALRHAGIRGWLAARPWVPTVVALTTVPALLCLLFTRATVGGLPMAAYGYTALGLFYGAVLLAVVSGRPAWLAAFCGHRLLVFVGGISYFVYLFQGIVGWAVFRLFGREHVALASTGDAALVGATLVALAGLGTLSKVFLEDPLIARGRRHRYLPA
jgi:peptidoglycan/LPS O-acetylase OafA/YrhL